MRIDKATGLAVALAVVVLVIVGLSACGAAAPDTKATGYGSPLAREYVGTTDVKYDHPADKTPYPCGSLTVAAGTWRISYRVMAYSSRPQADLGTVSAFAQLAANGVSTPEFLTGGRAGGNLYRAIFTLSAERVVTLLARTTFTLSIFESEGNGWDTLQCLGGRSWTIIRAEAL